MSSSNDPFEFFGQWYRQAQESEPDLPDAVALATADANGLPSVRMVLLKGVDENGFVFYTNLGSRKALELSANPNAALCIHWKTLQKQVRVEGTVTPVSAADADAYFASRPRSSRIGAWASRQSQPLEGRMALEAAVVKSTARFHLGDVPRPDFWSGFRIRPERIEFWSQGKFRLHERLEFRRAGDGWVTRKLYP